MRLIEVGKELSSGARSSIKKFGCIESSAAALNKSVHKTTYDYVCSSLGGLHPSFNVTEIHQTKIGGWKQCNINIIIP